MDPSIVPAGPVADHEVSAWMPVESNHRRHRHAPLLNRTEWMQAMYGSTQSPKRAAKNIQKPLPKIPTGPHGEPQRAQIPVRKMPFTSRTGKDEAQEWTKKLQKPLPAPPAARDADISRPNFVPIGPHTALGSHAPSEEERKYSIRVREGWQARRAKWEVESVMVSRVQDRQESRSGGSRTKEPALPHKKSVKDFFARR